jgi:hypothetical protein
MSFNKFNKMNNKNSSFKQQYKTIYVKMTAEQVIKSYEQYGNEMLKIDREDFKGQEIYYNSMIKIKCPNSGEYTPFKLIVQNVQQKKSIKEPADRYYASDVNVLLRLYEGDNDNFDESNPNLSILALKHISDVFMVKMEELIEQGIIWKTKNKNIKKADNALIVENTTCANFMQTEDKEGNEISNPIVYISFGNKNKLSRETQLPLIDDEGNEVKYKGQGLSLIHI